MTYKIMSSSHSRWPSKPYEQLMKDAGKWGGANPAETVSARIYFNSYTHEESGEKPSMSFVELLSNIGGSLGLCLGMSLVTVGETVELLSVLWTRARKVRGAAREERAREDRGGEMRDKAAEGGAQPEEEDTR
jgi:hypothetical protein